MTEKARIRRNIICAIEKLIVVLIASGAGYALLRFTAFLLRALGVD